MSAGAPFDMNIATSWPFRDSPYLDANPFMLARASAKVKRCPSNTQKSLFGSILCDEMKTSHRFLTPSLRFQSNNVLLVTLRLPSL